jgi:NhaP-type Na+/H+ or K+/H+ antiporter
MEHHVIVILASIALLGMGAQWLAWRFQIPAIILLTVFGILAGPVLGWIRPSEDLGTLFSPIIKLGVAIILFEGGLSLRFHELKQAAAGVLRLTTLGVLISFPFGSLAAHYLAGLSWPVALVFGAIIVVTGPTVIIPLLRQARLRKRPASYLKWEGIVNDPVGALLAVILFQYFVYVGDRAVPAMIGQVMAGLAFAAMLGVGVGFLLGFLYRRGFVPEYLKGPAALAVALGVYVLANLGLEEAGLMAVTLLGITLGNMRLPSIDEMRRFKESIALLIVSGVFILLTAELKPVLLLNLDWRSLVLLVAIIFVIRPLAIFLSTIGAGMPWQERALLGWIAPRGIVAAAVAGVFGPALEQQGYAGASLLLPLIFALILITVMLHGLSIGWLGRYLGLSAQHTHGVLIIGSNAWTIPLAQALKSDDNNVIIADNSWHQLRRARLAGVAAHYGDILTEASEERLEFSDFGHLVAATDNDAYNALVCNQFAGEFGRHRVYQLPDVSTLEPDPKRLPRTRRGLIIPKEDAWYEELMAKAYQGWTFQKTRLSDEFTYEVFLNTATEGIIPTALIREDGAIEFSSPEHPFNPKTGDTLLWFGPKVEKSKSKLNV